jgi:acyl-CoA thioesterase-1
VIGMKRTLLLLFGAALALCPGASLMAAPDCSAPAELIEDEPKLPQVARLFHDKQPVTIVVIGGASTAGLASGNAEQASYPQRLQEALKRRHPDIPVSVINKGVARQTTQEMVDRFPRDVFALSPNLVIWETGTFDAARNVDVDFFANALEAGLEELRNHNLDIMLVNMQYSRSTASVINFEPYLAAMQQRADIDDVYLFRRFELMKYWSENGVFNFVDVPQDRRARLASEVYQCIGERLADAIDYAVQ